MNIRRDLYLRLKNGIFAINKTKGLTSMQAIDAVKQAIIKGDGRDGTVQLMVGHGGTLDHTATGVLVVGLFEGCKQLVHFLKGPKRYEFTAKLGQATTTYNDTGEITHESDFSHVSKESLTAACEQFVGNILQTAPIYSALKYRGIRSSDLAKAGVAVEPKTRPVRCHSIVVKDVSLPFFSAEVSCGGGFYVRSLAHDLGIALGTHAHVVSLTRLVQSPFHLKDCLPMDQLSLNSILLATRRTVQLYGTKMPKIHRM